MLSRVERRNLAVAEAKQRLIASHAVSDVTLTFCIHSNRRGGRGHSNEHAFWLEAFYINIIMTIV